MGKKYTYIIADEGDGLYRRRRVPVEDAADLDMGFDEDIPEGCSGCGGDYPYCMDSCPLFDD